MTSHDEKRWRRFWRLFLSLFCLGWVVYTLLIVVIDPYDIFTFSPKMDRAPVVINQRFSYPAIARKSKFNSLILGTSTARLVDPEVLDSGLDSKFANLAMNSATAYEQLQIFNVFRRYHAEIKTLVIGLDIAWCAEGPDYKLYTSRPFPPWMYDDNPWNDFKNHYTLKTAETMVRQAGYLAGVLPALYGKNGYKNFLLPQSEYNLDTARSHLYPNGTVEKIEEQSPPFVLSNIERSNLSLPALKLLEEILAKSRETQTILFFVPYHFYYQGHPGTRKKLVWQKCKDRIVSLASPFENVSVLDFMIKSELTLKDENYWDARHYNLEQGRNVSAAIEDGANGRDNALFVVLE